MVGRGTPNTLDSNNGILVFYDEAGRPWITPMGKFSDHILNELVLQFDLKRGAHVPHSNDGGKFLREVVTKL